MASYNIGAIALVKLIDFDLFVWEGKVTAFPSLISFSFDNVNFRAELLRYYRIGERRMYDEMILEYKVRVGDEEFEVEAMKTAHRWIHTVYQTANNVVIESIARASQLGLLREKYSLILPLEKVSYLMSYKHVPVYIRSNRQVNDECTGPFEEVIEDVELALLQKKCNNGWLYVFKSDPVKRLYMVRNRDGNFLIYPYNYTTISAILRGSRLLSLIALHEHNTGIPPHLRLTYDRLIREFEE